MAKRKPFKLTSKIIPARAAIYCRVASVDQLEPLRGLDDQEKAVRESIEYRNSLGFNTYKVVGVYQERGSGIDLNRPELQKMLSDIQANKIDAVFVTDMARLTRSLRGLADIWHILRSHQCRLVSAHESLDTSQWLFTTLEKELDHA